MNQKQDFFNDFAMCIKNLKKSVYLIARGRPIKIQDQERTTWITLGTGFLAAPNRMITCAHVIDHPQKGEFYQHKDGDKYYLIRNDGDKFHYCGVELKLNIDIFFDHAFDIGIIYLPDFFYNNDVKKNDFIKIADEVFPIGSEIGILGYPMCGLTFEDENFLKPQIDKILLDKATFFL